VRPAHSTEPLPLPLLVFDGDCAFCTTSVNRLEAVLPKFPAKSPWQWLELDRYGLSVDDVTAYAWVITTDRQFGGHLALSALLRMQPSAPLRFAGHLIATPPFSLAAAGVYWLIAHNRHRLPGGTPACALPPGARAADSVPEDGAGVAAGSGVGEPPSGALPPGER
jgi:predicted DCC family thiol-disulfide oxidoreductase YuxK